jgi:hypothetical protein
MNWIIRKIFCGDSFRKTRLHDEQGHLVPFGEIGNLPLRALEAVLARHKIYSPAPWWPPAAARRINALIDRSWTVVEFGSGMSTLWLADRAGRVMSVESNRDWYGRISSSFGDRKNIDYLFRAAASYVDIPEVSGQLNLVVIDGERRADCIDWAMARLPVGGWIYLDNSDADKDHVATLPVRAFLARRKLLALAETGRISLDVFRGFPPANLVASEGFLVRVLNV